jgi:hypothetical protein
LIDLLVAKKLCIKVMNLERTMMNMRALVRAYEECMMVDIFLASVDMSKQCYIFRATIILIYMKPVCWNKIKVFEIKSPLRFEILYTDTIMTKLAEN